MKKFAVFFVFLPLGLGFIFLGGILGPWVDQVFHRPELLLSQSADLYEEGNLDACEKALKEFILLERASPNLRSVAFYNLGSISVDKARKGDPGATEDALFYFKEALRNDPLLFPAKYNLELLLRMRRKEESREGKSQGSSQNHPSSTDEQKEKLKQGLTTKPPFLGSNP